MSQIDIPMTTSHDRTCFYIIVGMQVETAVRYHIINIGMAPVKMQPHSQCFEDWKKK